MIEEDGDGDEPRRYFVVIAKADLGLIEEPPDIEELCEEARRLGMRVIAGWQATSPTHRPMCEMCREPWPCDHEMIDRQAKAFRHRLDMLCDHCGQEVRPGQQMVMFGGARLDPETGKRHGVKFHTAKSKYPKCTAAAAEFAEKLRAKA